MYGDYSKEEEGRLEAAGVDYDLEAAIRENQPQPFKVEDIKQVLAYHPGERDSDNNFEWIIQLLDNRIVYLNGWEDYTGWDCQSDLTAQFADSPRQAVGLATNKDELLAQVNSTKNMTWYEQTNKELGANK